MRPSRQVGSAPVAFMTLIGLVATHSAWAQSSFNDDFEASTLNSFWTVFQQFGSISLSTDQNHTIGGKQSVKFVSTSGGQREMHLRHDFPAPTNGNFSVYFYDVAPGQETLYEKLYLYNSSQPNLSAAVGTQDFDADCYSAAFVNSAGSAFGQNASCGVFPQLSTTSVPRTSGWHLLSVDVAATAITLAIDGQQLFTVPGSYSFDTIDIGVSGPSFRPDTVASFDDFAFIPIGDCSHPMLGRVSAVAPFHGPDPNHRLPGIFDGETYHIELLPESCDFSGTVVAESLNRVTGLGGECPISGPIRSAYSGNVLSNDGVFKWYYQDTFAIARGLTFSCTEMTLQWVLWEDPKNPSSFTRLTTNQNVITKDVNILPGSSTITVCSMGVCAPPTTYGH
jgi:hypothetical protein